MMFCADKVCKIYQNSPGDIPIFWFVDSEEPFRNCWLSIFQTN